jgi:Carboxypeptidase regulatory-like domain
MPLARSTKHDGNQGQQNGEDSMIHSKRRVIWYLAAALCLVALPAFAQTQAGNLFGTVSDEQGSALPGVTVTISGSGAPISQTTDEQGKFRFPGLSPGSYQLSANLEGFSPIEYPNVGININRTTEIELTMNAAIGETITVTTETPLLDPRRIATGNAVTQSELESIPTARDPWAVLQSTPGVLTDRINVGGNESGQQSQYVGPGSAGDQAVWSVDGVVITDMAALGSSPAYYDFDSFEEMQVTTGGSDASVATGGVVLNMVTKRGTNEWRGSGRYLLTDQDWQSDNNTSASDHGRAGPWNANAGNPNGANQPIIRQGNRIVDVKDFGAELGGPVVKDRLWIWGSYGKQEVDLLTIADVSDFTDLETMNLKANAQLAESNSATFTALSSDKVKIGRNAGPVRPQETTWNQSKFGDDPTSAKLEDTHVFSSSFYLTGMYSFVNGGFQLAPQGGDVTTYLDLQSVWHNSFYLYQTERPQEQIKLDGSAFFNTGSVANELRFGAGLRQAEVASTTRWGGSGYLVSSDYFGGNYGYLYAARDGFAKATTDYTSLYVQDTLSVGNLTANVGLRYDLQDGQIEDSTARAHPVYPTILPSISTQSMDAGFEWESITPRLGLTYALGEERKTLLRASYSRFADQLGSATTNWLNTAALNSYAYFLTDPAADGALVVPTSQILDLNENGVFDRGDVIGFSGNVNPVTLGALQSNTVDPNLDPQMTDELLFSVEHALRPEFVLGLNVTYRQITDILESDRLVFDSPNAFCTACLTNTGRRNVASDYVLVTATAPATRPRLLPNGEPYTLRYYQLRTGVTSRGGGHLFNGDGEQEYTGLSATFNKRLANRWMMRGNFTWSDWNWKDVGGLEDPTHILGAPDQNGDVVLQGSGTGSGSKGGVYISSEWSYSINGLYQVAPDRPWGFNVAANLTGRQGYPVPYFERLNPGVRAGIPGFTRVQVVDEDQFRLDDIHVIDARVEKEFSFSDFGVTVGLDIFNLTNEGTVLQRNHRLRVGPNANVPLNPSSDFVSETLSPRIFRVGARFSFR